MAASARWSLHDDARRLALWRFTLGHHPQALLLQQKFEQQVGHLSASGGRPPQSEPDDEAHCEACGAVLPPDAEECPACARQQAPQTSTWVLLRLWRFAHPYRHQLLLGFLLTLASTSATLVAPYLTIPIVDKILIPFQNGQRIDAGLVGFYLGGCCCRPWWPGAWAGRAPSCWPRCPSASAPTCAPPPTSTC